MVTKQFAKRNISRSCSSRCPLITLFFRMITVVGRHSLNPRMRTTVYQLIDALWLCWCSRSLKTYFFGSLFQDFHYDLYSSTAPEVVKPLLAQNRFHRQEKTLTTWDLRMADPVRIIDLDEEVWSLWTGRGCDAKNTTCNLGSFVVGTEHIIIDIYIDLWFESSSFENNKMYTFIFSKQFKFSVFSSERKKVKFLELPHDVTWSPGADCGWHRGWCLPGHGGHWTGGQGNFGFETSFFREKHVGYWMCIVFFFVCL